MSGGPCPACRHSLTPPSKGRCYVATSHCGSSNTALPWHPQLALHAYSAGGCFGLLQWPLQGGAAVARLTYWSVCVASTQTVTGACPAPLLATFPHPAHPPGISWPPSTSQRAPAATEVTFRVRGTVLVGMLPPCPCFFHPMLQHWVPASFSCQQWSQPARQQM